MLIICFRVLYTIIYANINKPVKSFTIMQIMGQAIDGRIVRIFDIYEYIIKNVKLENLAFFLQLYQ